MVFKHPRENRHSSPRFVLQETLSLEPTLPQFYEKVMGVYFDDLDPYRILHNARYLLLFERTLGSFWEHLGLQQMQLERELLHLVRANHIEYLHAVRGTGNVRMRVHVERLGTTSLTFGFRMMPLNEDIDHAVGSRTVVRVDSEHWKPTPWSDEFKALIQPWIVPNPRA